MDDKLEIQEVSSGDPSIEGRYHRFNKLLGKGAYKSVYKAFDSIQQVDVAWNSIDLSQMTENEKNKVFLECEMLQKLNHDNILKIRNKWRNDEKDELIFVTDIIQNGSLRKYFKKRKINLKSIKQICYQILLALDYLHNEQNVIHRDLKCDNIFIDSSSNNNKIVLGDLGLSVNFTGQSRMSIVGTPHWMAPELYNEKYNELVDIWSFGMCVLELTTNTIPYKECKNTIAVYNKVMINKQKPDILNTIRDPYIKAFINICLYFNPTQRPTAKELLSHPFLLTRYPRDYILCERLLSTHNNNINNNNNNNNNVNNGGKRRRAGHNGTKRGKKKDDVTVHTVTSKKNCITTIKLQIYRKDDKPMAVTFDFNSTVDKSGDVAQEMISELQLPHHYKTKVENAIESAIQVENNNKTQIIGRSLTGIIPPSNNNPNKPSTLAVPKKQPKKRGKPKKKKSGKKIQQPQQPIQQPVQQPIQQPVQQPVQPQPIQPQPIQQQPIQRQPSKEGVPSTNDVVNSTNNNDNNNNNNDNNECVGRFIEIKNDLHLNDLSSYLSPGELEIDEKAQEQIIKKRDEILKEYKEFVITKNELLKLRVESITETEQRENAILKMKQKFEKKKHEMVQQYENFINDYKDIAQYTITSKQMEIYQHFNFESDPQFTSLMKSQLSETDKYQFQNQLKERRQQIVDQYIKFYSNSINKYKQQINKI